MKKTKLVVALFSLLFFSITLTQGYAAIKIVDKEKCNLNLYGFFKFDATYQDNPMNSLIAPRYAKFGDGNYTNFTAMNSRFGLKLSGLEIGNGWKVKGNFEFDLFDGSSRNQMKLRTRHAYFSLSKGNSSFLAGQYWDLFSPIGPTTLMTNGYLWNVGNLGFRRAQIRYTYTYSNISFAISLNDPTSNGAIETGLPLIQARAGLKFGNNEKYKVGISGAYGKDRNTETQLVYENDVNIIGLGIDWIIPFTDCLTIKGELGIGKNLSIFLSRANVYNNTINKEFEGKKVISFWSELLYKVKKINVWLGYSFENLTDEDQLSTGSLKDTSCILSGVKYTLGKGVSFGLEYAHFLSKHLDLENKAKTNQLIFSGIYSF